MTIDSVHLREIHLPLVEPFANASGVQSLRRILLLEIKDVDGFSGWSECVAQEAPNYAPETVDTARHILTEWLIPKLRGVTIRDPRAVHDLLAQGVRGNEMARASLEMGVWHLESERQGVSLASLLGGTRARVPVGISIGLQSSPEDLVAKIAACHDQGYQRIKLKVKPGADRQFLGAVREAFGTQLPLSVDANAAYRPSDLELLRSLDEFELTMIEQPLQHDDLLRHARLQREIRAPICLDESITSVDRAEDMIELGSGRIINIKPGRVGGHTPSIAIHDLCAAHDLPVWCGGMLESGIGRAHNVALASLGNFRLPGDLSPSRRYWEQDVVIPEWTMSADGYVEVPHDRPGLGVRIDMDRIDDLTIRHEVVKIG